MTTPRNIVPERSWFITRRCANRQFFLRPSAFTNQNYLYFMGLAAERTDIQVVGFVAMSNHHHAVVYDPGQELPKFMEYFHGMLARALNRHLNRTENVWASTTPVATHLVTPDDELAALRYILANPVAAHLVDRIAQWPGASSYSAMLSGEPIKVQRPTGYLDPHGPSPEEVTFALRRPKECNGLSQSEWVDKLTAMVACAENEARSERARKGIPVLGREAILNTSPFDRPNSPGRCASVVHEVSTKNQKLREQAREALKAFRRAYAWARQKLLIGETDVLFPFGTYKMRLMGLNCALAPG